MHKPARVPTLAKMVYQDIYNTPRWKRIRRWKIRNYPLCEKCLEKDPPKTTVAQEVHHKIPWATGSTPDDQEALAYDIENLQSVCIECHKSEHAGINRQ